MNLLVAAVVAPLIVGAMGGEVMVGGMGGGDGIVVLTESIELS